MFESGSDPLSTGSAMNAALRASTTVNVKNSGLGPLTPGGAALAIEWVIEADG